MSQPLEIDEIRRVVLAVLHEKFGIDPTKVSDTTHFANELDLDSIDFFDITGTLEKQYELDIDFTEFASVTTFGEFMKVLEAVITRKNGQ
jgi:acyl carrier protein